MVYANPIWVAEDVASTRFEESNFMKILLKDFGTPKWAQLEEIFTHFPLLIVI